ncbi:regulatory protein RecX [Olivibacter sp. XZL3]|uniref:regulatory protein RecX n=1 Tax=Olivibacter sp. XZL3 TaxID=1735116 RepID=UPI001065FC6F|nr:regulatory protein RecX [Olivibacter sp. XZL3]
MDDERAIKPKIYTKREAKLKAESYCAYQERSQQEVRDKLYAWGLHQGEVEETIADLITENFLNEERFALAYTSGKFKLKGWGRIRIKQGLKMHRVSPRLIQDALKAIPPEEYLEKLEALLEKKAAILKESDPYKRKNKLVQYALSKGYENDLIFDILSHNNL